jgi:hypothetical protein
VKAKMTAEKLDPAIVDKSPDELIPLSSEGEGGVGLQGLLGSTKKNTPIKGAQSTRKKKLFWKGLDSRFLYFSLSFHVDDYAYYDLLTARSRERVFGRMTLRKT